MLMVAMVAAGASQRGSATRDWASVRHRRLWALGARKHRTQTHARATAVHALRMRACAGDACGVERVSREGQRRLAANVPRWQQHGAAKCAQLRGSAVVWCAGAGAWCHTRIVHRTWLTRLRGGGRRLLKCRRLPVSFTRTGQWQLCRAADALAMTHRALGFVFSRRRGVVRCVECRR